MSRLVWHWRILWVVGLLLLPSLFGNINQASAFALSSGCAPGLPVAVTVPTTKSADHAYTYDASAEESRLSLPSEYSGGRLRLSSCRVNGLVVTSTPTIRFPTVATNTAGAAGEVGETSIHGAERIAGPAATRGGVLSSAEIAEVRSGAQQVFSQTNGATAKVFQQADGRFSVVVDGDRGFMTSFKNLSQGSLDRIAKNYGWKPE